ncbi:MAG TPA: N(4)-(beta-N-acetylglucosaminyl)-L-asparaginase [Terriglobales bacterium]|nr:N(4)-(beta-N-acetylglucosaminyl)-L-asparaginase [Terriglobales bacterium]
MKTSRRDFLVASSMTAAAVGLDLEAQQPPSSPRRPAIISKVTGSPSQDGAYQLLQRGGDTLDAALFVCRAQEDDPTDDSVGLGGLPNEEGVVELDACCMHGPTRRAGAVASVRGIRNVSMLARTVMERTDHLLLVGEGAARFARAHGFPEVNLLTERSRKTWLLWKETMSRADSWGPGLADPKWTPPTTVPPLDALKQQIRWMEEVAARLGIEPEFRRQAIERVLFPPTGTIHVSVVNEKGEMSGATTTSGLAWKIPGRVGDSPIIGAGCWTDQDVGSAGATGRGEDCIKICGAHTIVENMRRGMEPTEAGLDALRRIARNYNNDMTRLRFVEMIFYILRNDGAYAGVSMWNRTSSGKPTRFAIHDGTRRIENCVPLFEGTPVEWPPAEWQAAS